MRRGARRVTRLYDDALARHGINAGQLSILAAVHAMDRPSVQALADVSDMDQSAMSRALVPLERDGLVGSARDTVDRRRRRVELTDAGRDRLRAAALDWQAAQAALEAEYGASDLVDLRRSIDGLARGR
jgi:DNA-binding MarR family transcriptional regulator